MRVLFLLALSSCGVKQFVKNFPGRGGAASCESLQSDGQGGGGRKCEVPR